jgi:hyperosmotically inducible protein
VIEARSSAHIVTDNEIALAVNSIMLQLGDIGAATTIYEQRLLVTGFFDNKTIYDELHKRIAAIKGLRELYWHAVYMSREEQLRSGVALLDSAGAFALESGAQGKLLLAPGVASSNFRVAVDSFGNLYLVGRAFSTAERDTAVESLRSVEGIKDVVAYVEIR